MIDVVVSLHMDPLTCGTAKFNHELARRLGVPCKRLGDEGDARHPLYSLRARELGWHTCRRLVFGREYSLFIHECDNLWLPFMLPARGDIFAANHEVATWVYEETGRQAREVFCPSSVYGNQSRGSIDVLMFGMAHKCQIAQCGTLKALLDKLPLADYTVSLSTAIHEGEPLNGTFSESVAIMRHIFGKHLRHLGFLADDGLARLIDTVNAVALFYAPAARANNTTLWTALESGRPVITNLDHDSPPELVHDLSVFDIAKLEEWPSADRLRAVRHGGSSVSRIYSWDRLMASLKDVSACEQSCAVENGS